jgi:hypothetical protein
MKSLMMLGLEVNVTHEVLSCHRSSLLANTLLPLQSSFYLERLYKMEVFGTTISTYNNNNNQPNDKR